MRYYPFDAPNISTHKGEKTKPIKKTYYVKAVKVLEEEKTKLSNLQDGMLYLERLANPFKHKRQNYSIEQITNKLENR